ncbi:MAG: insulinase family protein [Bacteroidota bacterium]|jgi:predicted Zn-dependent peptidase|nr:insulinase family protein [Bacteroidota bacterium]
MKSLRFFTLLALLLFVGASAHAQIDRSKKPAPGPAPKVSFPEFHETTLDNGLKVFIISNHAQPVVTFRLLVKSGSEYDGEVSGIANAVTDLLTSGTTTRDMLAFAREEDQLGLSIGAAAADDQMSVSGSGLKKHMDKLLTLMTDALYNPTFPQEELDKLKKQSLSGLQTVKRSPDEVMERLKLTVGYAPHPYANFGTEEDVERTTREALVQFHKTYFIPNNASLAIVGDVTPKEILPVVKKYFGRWKKGTLPTNTFPKPRPINGRTVHLVDLGKTQSQTSITAMVTGIERRDADYLSATLMNSIIGGGFSGRLFANLREKHGFTYGAYSSFEARRSAGVWAASADVRRIATDSAFTQILLEMERMRNEAVDGETLDMHKQYAAGRFLLGLENPSTVATMVQNIDLYGLPKDYYRTYVSNIMKLTPADLQRTARTYFTPENIALLAVGDASVIREPLSALGDVHMYDTDMNPVAATTSYAVDIDGPTLLEKYITAMGGRAVLEKTTTRITEGNVTMSFGPASAEGTMKQIGKAPNKRYQLLTFAVDMGGGPQIMEVEEWVNGEQAWQRQPMQQTVEITGDELAQTLEEDRFNGLLYWKELGFVPTVTAKKDMNGTVVYVLDIKKKHGNDELYIDASNYLLVGKSESSETPQGPVVSTTTVGDYRPVDGIMLPHAMTVENPGMTMKMTITSYTHNVDVADEQFSPKQ